MAKNNVLAAKIKTAAAVTNGTMFANLVAYTYEFKVRRILLGVGTNSGVSLVTSPVIVGLVFTTDPGTATTQVGFQKEDDRHTAITSNVQVDTAWSTNPSWSAPDVFLSIPFSTDKPEKVSWNSHELWARQVNVNTPHGIGLFNDGPDLPSGHYLVASFEIEV